MIDALKLVVNCESFGLEENFQSIYFGHVFSKTCTTTKCVLVHFGFH
jgi:hypothetical protein